MNNILTFLAGGAGIILILVIGLAQIAIGFVGIEYHFGAGWAVGALVLSFMFRFSLPLTIGTFFGAIDVFNWHWIAALLITLPGLLLMIPGVIAAGIAGLSSSFNKEQSQSYQSQYNYEEPKDVTPREESIKKTKSPSKKAKKVTKKKTKKITKKK